jgi:hypothetical protein
MTTEKSKPSRRELVAAMIWQILECAKTNNESSIDGTLMSGAFDEFLKRQDGSGYVFSYSYPKKGLVETILCPECGCEVYELQETCDECNEELPEPEERNETVSVVELGSKGNALLNSLIDYASNIVKLSENDYSDEEE